MRLPPSTLALVAAALLATGCSLLDSGNVFELAVGDCFDDAGGTQISEVPIVDCAEPHDNEVFRVYDVADGDYPGDDALVQQAVATCLPALDDYVGDADVASQLDAFPITPTAGSWEDGDREVVCALYDADLAKLEGSMRGGDR